MTTTGTPPGAAEAPAYPMERTCPYGMPPGYQELRERRPLSRVTLYDGRQVWLVSGNAEGRALLLDPRLSSSTRHPAFPYLSQGLAAQQEIVELPLVGVDGTEHARQRRMLSSGFGIRRIAALRPQIERIAQELVDAMLAGGPGADLVAAYTLPLASGTTFALLGVPPEDRRRLGELSHRALSASDEDTGAAARESFDVICGYLDDLIARREQEPGDGLIDELVAQRPAGGDRRELVMLCAVLLVGGNESTSTTIASSVLALFEHPEQLDRLRADPSLTAGAVEELTRLVSVTDALARVATADIEVAGHTIRRGDGVIVSTLLMNRDPAAWDDPDALDVHHKAGRHVAFGYGIHQCVGQNLARAEMEIALNTLFRRLPNLRPAGPPGQLPGGAVELPVTW